MTLTRTPIASRLCPTLPFLAPRLLRSSLPVATLPPRCLTYIRGFTKPGYFPKPGQWSRRPSRIDAQFKGRNDRLEQLFREEDSVMDNLKSACDACYPAAILNIYPNLLSLPSLSRDVTRRMAQATHTFLRAPGTKGKEQREALSLVERIVADIRSGRLPPHPLAHRHILSIYKERDMFEEGFEFWQWLANQSELFVDPSVYGAAIELLAFKGNVTLQTLENLFTHALKRFPGTFAEYHLSPDAIVPDRSQPFDVVGVPITLLQGILTARILARDWRNSYLAFDTALRLHPSSLPPRFFELFMIERPVSECYTVFLMGCRAGIQFKATHLMAILNRLRRAIASTESMEDRLLLVRAMTNATYAYMEAGGTPGGAHLSVLLNTGYANIIPTMHPGQDYPEQIISFRNVLVNSAHQAASKLIQSGSRAKNHILKALINIASKLNVPQLFSVALNDLETSSQDLDMVDHRVVLAAAGRLGDKKEVERRWAIIAKGESEGNPPTEIDWVTLARACKRAGNDDFCLAQLQILRHTLTDEVESLVQVELRHQPEAHTRFTPMDPNVFSEQMEAIDANMTRMAAVLMAGQPLDLQKTPFDMHIIPSRKPYGGSITNLKRVYDKLTTDPHQPEANPDPNRPSLSSTGIPLGELRFQNWLSIVELMNEAETGERILQEKIDEAIRESKTFDIKAHNASFDVLRKAQEGQKDWNPSYEELLSKIKNLRAVDPSNLQAADRVLQPKYLFKNVQRPNSLQSPEKVPLRMYISGSSAHLASRYMTVRPSVLHSKDSNATGPTGPSTDESST